MVMSSGGSVVRMLLLEALALDLGFVMLMSL